MIRVALFPADALNATELHNALSRCVNVEVWGASSEERHAKYVFKNYHSGLPNVADPGFYDEFAGFVRERGIDVVVPTHDTVVLEFARNRDRIPARVLVCDERTAEVCRSKRACLELFADCGFSPRFYREAAEVESFPVFAKPDRGQGAVGARRVDDAEGLALVDFGSDVVCEYLPGEELTVDCLTDSRGALRVVSPRTRTRVQAGVSVASESVGLTSEVADIASEINARLGFLGLWFFQLKKATDGGFRLMEVSARCAGTMCLTRARGYNLPLMSVYAAMGVDLDVMDGGYAVRVDREIAPCYETDVEYDVVYLDYDDTLVMRDGSVNLDAARFVYQCRNKGVPVRLITRHEGDLLADLRRSALSEALFDQIICVGEGERKCDLVDAGARGLFIDNAFKERREMRERTGWPVFDVSEIEVLQDYRF